MRIELNCNLEAYWQNRGIWVGLGTCLPAGCQCFQTAFSKSATTNLITRPGVRFSKLQLF